MNWKTSTGLVSTSGFMITPAAIIRSERPFPDRPSFQIARDPGLKLCGAADHTENSGSRVGWSGPKRIG